MPDLPCGVCQTKGDPLIWSQQERSTRVDTQEFQQEQSVAPSNVPEELSDLTKFMSMTTHLLSFLMLFYFFYSCNGKEKRKHCVPL